MNIHEHQAKNILKEFGAPVSNGVVILSLDEIKQEIHKLKGKEFVLKAQIHEGGRGKAGGVKLIKNINDLETNIKMIVKKNIFILSILLIYLNNNLLILAMREEIWFVKKNS